MTSLFSKAEAYCLAGNSSTGLYNVRVCICVRVFSWYCSGRSPGAIRGVYRLMIAERAWLSDRREKEQECSGFCMRCLTHLSPAGWIISVTHTGAMRQLSGSVCWSFDEAVAATHSSLFVKKILMNHTNTNPALCSDEDDVTGVESRVCVALWTRICVFFSRCCSQGVVLLIIMSSWSHIFYQNV